MEETAGAWCWEALGALGSIWGAWSWERWEVLGALGSTQSACNVGHWGALGVYEAGSVGR